MPYVSRRILVTSGSARREVFSDPPMHDRAMAGGAELTGAGVVLPRPRKATPPAKTAMARSHLEVDLS
jgi:hypothetical protein